MYDLDLTNRRTFIESLNNLDNFKTAVEVGVRTGWYTKYILDHTEMTVCSIDPWEINEELSVGAEEAYNHCKKLTEPYGERCKMKKECSPQAADSFVDESVDLVYIDALHDYESVSADIRAWYSKVREGGIIAGHDYQLSSWPGVVVAVDEFAEEEGLEVLKTGIVGNARESMVGDIAEYDGNEPSWIIVKEE